MPGFADVRDFPTNAAINYLPAPSASEPESIARLAGFKRKAFDARRVHVADVRGQEWNFNLDEHGFEYTRSTKAQSSFPANPEDIPKDFYPEISALVKEVTGASRVLVLGHEIRDKTWQEAIEEESKLADDEAVPIGGAHARFAHVDYSYIGAKTFIDSISKLYTDMYQHPDSMKKFAHRPNVTDQPELSGITSFTQSRWAMINVWKPISHPVTRDPLAVCDSSSVPEEDLFEDSPDMIERVKKFGTWYLKASANCALDEEAVPQHRWHYLSDMTPEEVLLIKCFDSKLDGRARRCPHTAVAMDGDHGRTRQSVEVRTVLCWDGQPVE